MKKNSDIWQRRYKPSSPTPYGNFSLVEEQKLVPRQGYQREIETRLFGFNACRAVFAHRPQDLRKVYLTESHLGSLKDVLTWCVKHRLGYRVVETADLDKLTQTQHHEGVCFEAIRKPLLAASELLAKIPAPPAPALLIYLDGVGNPHNFGAVMRSAAHFGAAGIILPPDSSLSLSGAACRVAEGGAETLLLTQAKSDKDIVEKLHKEKFELAAAVLHNGENLYKNKLPKRLMLIFGAEAEGVSQHWVNKVDKKLTIPGSGLVQSLNISASAAVFLGEYYRQHELGN